MSIWKVKDRYRNEEGMALVTAMLILVALTLLGVTAMTNTTIDSMIAGNDYKEQQVFYASEGAQDLALAVLPALISGDNKAVTDMGIQDVDDLLAFDGDKDGQADGKITPILNSFLGSADFFADYCRPLSSSGLQTYTIRIFDDSDERRPDPLKDSNFQVFLVTSEIDPEDTEQTPRDLIRYTLKRLLINHDAAVNLIEKDGGVGIQLGAGASVDGGKDTNKEGVVTTDMVGDFSSISAQVMPHGVVQGFDQFVNPSLGDLHEVVDLLTKNRTPLPHDPASDSSVTLTIDDVNGNHAEIVYVQGQVILADSLKNKVLVIEDYKPPCSTGYDTGLTIQEGKHFEGLILLLPRHDVGTPVTISLESGATIKGAVIASSVFDPLHPESSPGITLDLQAGDKTKISYDDSKIVSTGLERQFAVLKREYLSF